MVKGSLPRRYARALLELAKQEKQIEAFGEALKQLQTEVQKMPQILEVLANDSFESSQRLAVIEKIAQKAGYHPLFRNFLLLLVKKDRISLLPEISREYGKLTDEILGIVRMSVASPVEPSADIRRRIEKIFGEHLQKKIITKSEIRPEIIGGLILKINHIIYDGSVRRELERMKEGLLRG